MRYRPKYKLEVDPETGRESELTIYRKHVFYLSAPIRREPLHRGVSLKKEMQRLRGMLQPLHMVVRAAIREVQFFVVPLPPLKTYGVIAGIVVDAAPLEEKKAEEIERADLVGRANVGAAAEHAKECLTVRIVLVAASLNRISPSMRRAPTFLCISVLFQTRVHGSHGLTMKTTRGDIWYRLAQQLQSLRRQLVEKQSYPVALASGRLTMATRPISTGMLEVADLAAYAAAFETAYRTATLRPTRSAAMPEGGQVDLSTDDIRSSCSGLR